MKRRKRESTTINRRIGIVAGIEGGLAQLGFFTHQVQRVVRLSRVPMVFIHEYFFPIAQAALWNTNELKLRVRAKAHWPLVWELAAACEEVRNLPKSDPVYWLLRLDRLASACQNKRTPYDSSPVSWPEIAAEIFLHGGPDFRSARSNDKGGSRRGNTSRLRKAAERLKLNDNPELVTGYLRSPLAVT